MTYSAKVTLKYDSIWDSKGGIYDDEMLPEQHITMEVPAEDLNTMQLFKLWESFLQSMGHTELSIMKGACYLAFNDMRSDENMSKIADEFDLKTIEDHYEIVANLQELIDTLRVKLKEISELDQSDISNDLNYSSWNHLTPGSPEAYSKGCKCPILDNQSMPNDRKWVNANCPIHGKKH